MNEKVILFFDGECVLCNKVVQWILKHEKVAIIQFCRLNSEYAQKYIPAEYKKTDSVILFMNNRFYIYFDAFIQIIPYLKWQWKFLYVIKILPDILQKKIYNYIARNRKKWFGSTDECWIMKSEWRKRVIEQDLKI